MALYTYQFSSYDKKKITKHYKIVRMALSVSLLFTEEIYTFMLMCRVCIKKTHTLTAIVYGK